MRPLVRSTAGTDGMSAAIPLAEAPASAGRAASPLQRAAAPPGDGATAPRPILHRFARWDRCRAPPVPVAHARPGRQPLDIHPVLPYNRLHEYDVRQTPERREPDLPSLLGPDALADPQHPAAGRALRRGLGGDPQGSSAESLQALGLSPEGGSGGTSRPGALDLLPAGDRESPLSPEDAGMPQRLLRRRPGDRQGRGKGQGAEKVGRLLPGLGIVRRIAAV